ncbi:M61 family metallopeptidase [Winogradskyella thalassocola]|uniref:Predicted metalloprotease, contains C-terminal PDZ domain n=1 Tax=Winogradskyella thalassocola TaxID=262004 RepID=A0A1G8D073_9FLAO|nr:peptidase M61 [Winogradskyella thalassocola]SDH50789.1 Predicted metalloprotease, contains C-terminal PDZ domain [Winogradskyella thalassocola]
MKNYFAILGLSIVLVGCGSVKTNVDDLAVSHPIETALDLTAVNNDRVPVTINPGRFTTETVTYRLPRVVQGTYSIGDYGKYIDDFKALDYDGNELATTKVDDNTWTIADAEKLDKLQYYVNDTFDIESVGGIGGEEPFSPAGTNIEDENFVLNLHGFIGYFDSLKNAQYAVDVTAPSDFIRTSALEDKGTTLSEDGKSMTTSYFGQRYFDITDNPMMYGKLDVEEFMVGDIKIVLSLYSPTKKHTAESLKETVFKMMEAQKRYLGDINSTPRYDIYLYLSRGGQNDPKGYGALEHQTSTVGVFAEDESPESLKESVIDVIAHEFFHIVTPLSVHSEDVHYFDYNTPTFSKHLWMYEGVTEYFAQHFQVYEGLIENNKFYNTLYSKINTSKRWDDAMSFTIMSENVLNEPYATNYYNVYYKGALIGMCIDILMRKESDGNRSMLSLMKELSAKYGGNKPFEDDKLIAEITAMTYPSVGEFLKTHVQGDLPINYKDYLALVGLTFGETDMETNYIFAGEQNIIFDGDQLKGTIFFSPMALNNSFWKAQGIVAGDVIKKVNGRELTLFNANDVISGMFEWKEGQEIIMDLERDGKPIEIMTTLTKAYAPSESIIEDENVTEAQKAVRAAWLKG